MKTILKWIIPACFILLIIIKANGQMVTKTEAARIAENWINVIIDEKGSWGEYTSAGIQPLLEITKKKRKLGYYCNVKPAGYIILSLRKEFAPVKAYSPTGYFDPLSKDVGTDIILTSLEWILDTIESNLGFIENIGPGALKPMLEIDYTEVWEEIYNYIPGTWSAKTEKEGSKDNYQEGEIMLDGNNWHQHPPFNDDCPIMGCSNSNGRAVVGCVATAGIQIMRHWAWPPYGVSPYNDSYDWPNMPDVVTLSSPQAEINAVAELGYEVAVAVNMNFGCDGSGAAMYDMEGVFENYYRFSTISNIAWRSNYTSTEWFNMIKSQLNLNRPMEYGIIGHAIVCDGWQEIGFPFVIRQYHMNWGWTATSNDTWYTLDALPEGGIDIEHVVRDIVPNCALGSLVTGSYPTLSPNYRYFDRDAIGYNATFQNGQFLQFLPGIVLTGISSADPIRFYGSNFLNTRLFTDGDLSNGIRLYDGEMELTNFGSIKFYAE